MGRSPYQGEKRRKELARLKKQEEKRQKRFNKRHGTSEAADGTQEAQPGLDAPAGAAPEAAQVDPPVPQEPSAQAPGESPEGGQQP